ncbi:hypothetical protein U27_01558 [Candidatus Vecturithrix granuli]|uniref:Uncharacterized protein n=1 Tax=Vecturithrix granuli TaxID=1499967 RepID=A0A081CAQ2_VECG1|nr:hypothetical protein U27_01558 [Candidatus Vecturithrix granuli]
MKIYKGLIGRIVVLVIVSSLMSVFACYSITNAETVLKEKATLEEITAFFTEQGKTVVTFVGYSGAGYEDPQAMLQQAKTVLGTLEPAATIINIGATPDGIGAIYPLAKQQGFMTTGIVSSQALEYEVAVSPDVDYVFFVEDETWGGFLEGTEQLSPTSEAMVAVSETMIGIGGGAVSRDEMIAAGRAGKKVQFIPADMNHERAKEKARKKGQPEPTDFHGEAHQIFGK